MIASAALISEPLIVAGDWKAEWRAAFRTAGDLLEALNLGAYAEQLDVDPEQSFPLRVPRAFVRRMRKGDPNDPLLLQVLARQIENHRVDGFVHDPVGDAEAKRTPGVLHKYAGRALLIVTGSCAVHCRYCFRRHFPYAEQSVTPAQWDAALLYLQAQDDVEEILLSGGDPLSLDTPKLAALCQRLRALPQLKRLRIHTRLPVVLPARVDAELIRFLHSLPWNLSIVVHCNHGQEIDAETKAAFTRLRSSGAILLNQTVLLRGINDTVAAQRGLSEALFDAGVLPYYLHQLDPVAGAAHFSVTDDAAVALVHSLRTQLPGYLVPRLVREVAGEPNKTVLA